MEGEKACPPKQVLPLQCLRPVKYPTCLIIPSSTSTQARLCKLFKFLILAEAILHIFLGWLLLGFEALEDIDGRTVSKMPLFRRESRHHVLGEVQDDGHDFQVQQTLPHSHLFL
ncbi:hypothetical protein ACH5RR_029469 [Cinchona calisaya]|uniref:Uncharacterized protein n=1 Tax=Cinchona calisaya TaxID=153742 RepID=A0ABD2YSY5_9GENT